MLAHRFPSVVSALEFVIGRMHLIHGHMEALHCKTRLHLRTPILAFRILEWLSYNAFLTSGEIKLIVIYSQNSNTVAQSTYCKHGTHYTQTRMCDHDIIKWASYNDRVLIGLI